MGGDAVAGAGVPGVRLRADCDHVQREGLHLERDSGNLHGATQREEGTGHPERQLQKLPRRRGRHSVSGQPLERGAQAGSGAGGGGPQPERGPGRGRDDRGVPEGHGAGDGLHLNPPSGAPVVHGPDRCRKRRGPAERAVERRRPAARRERVHEEARHDEGREPDAHSPWALGELALRRRAPRARGGDGGCGP